MSSQPTRQIPTLVGRNLKAARKARGLTQRKLAEKVGTDAFQISRWEQGRHRPSDATLVRLGEILRVDYADFFEKAA